MIFHLSKQFSVKSLCTELPRCCVHTRWISKYALSFTFNRLRRKVDALVRTFGESWRNKMMSAALGQVIFSTPLFRFMKVSVEGMEAI